MFEAADVVVIKKSGAGDPGVSCFTEVAETVQYALRRAGVASSVFYNRFSRSKPAVVFGAHELTADEMRFLPPSAVVYNLEQLGSNSRFVSGPYLDLLRRCRVWDYSRRNVAILAGLGIAARHMPIGHVPEMNRIPDDQPQPIDVLFYGAVNERRRAVLDALGERGLHVVALQHYYGGLRDRFVAQAKVVVNPHFYEAGTFEIVRVSYLLSNRKAVVAERHADSEIEPDMLDAVTFAPYDGLADACAALVADADARARQAETGWRRMTARDAVAGIREALGDLAAV